MENSVETSGWRALGGELNGEFGGELGGESSVEISGWRSLVEIFGGELWDPQASHVVTSVVQQHHEATCLLSNQSASNAS